MAVAGVLALCEHLTRNHLATRAVIWVEPENHASVRVAQKAGFGHVHDVTADGTTLSQYVLDLVPP